MKNINSASSTEYLKIGEKRKKKGLFCNLEWAPQAKGRTWGAKNFFGNSTLYASQHPEIWSNSERSLHKFSCGAHSKLQYTPLFRLFHQFSNAHYSKQNWYFLIQWPPKSCFFNLVFFKNYRDTLFCNPYFSRWLKRNEILGNSSQAGLL